VPILLPFPLASLLQLCSLSPVVVVAAVELGVAVAVQVESSLAQTIHSLLAHQ
jgi:hypothetical protein